jgi:hypothetical protein
VIPDAGASPAYLPKAVARAAGPRPSERPGTSLRAKAAAMEALVGGPTGVRIRGVEVEGALVDAYAAYPVVASLLGTGSWLQAERIEQRHLTPGRGLARLVTELKGLDADRLLGEPLGWRSLAGVALARSASDLLAVRGRLLGEVEDHTGTVPVVAGSEAVWVGLPRVVASMLRTGQVPDLIEAYTFQPEGLTAGARPVELPGGIVFDPRLDRARRGRRFRDLAMALAEVGLRAKAGTLRGIAPADARRMAGAVKLARNVAAFGGPAEFNPSIRAHLAWGPYGKLPKPIHEEPGWLTDPVAASLVVSGCELLLTLLEVLVAQHGGSTVFVDTDAAYVTLSESNGPIPVPARGAAGESMPTDVGRSRRGRWSGSSTALGPSLCERDCRSRTNSHASDRASRSVSDRSSSSPTRTSPPMARGPRRHASRSRRSVTCCRRWDQTVNAYRSSPRLTSSERSRTSVRTELSIPVESRRLGKSSPNSCETGPS